MAQLTLRSLDIPSIHKFGIGFDSMLDELLRLNAGQTNYPPYNIVKHTEDIFSIEIAIAGFTQGEIEIELSNRVLTIKGSKMHDLDNPKEYLYHGISNRNFEREFVIGEHVEVKEATNENGILTINLERIIPEDRKPKRIEINYNK